MQFRSSTPDLHNFYNSFLQKNRALNALSLLYCTPYTESKNIFLIFVRDEIPHFRFVSFYRAQRFICVFLPYSRPRAYLIYIHAKPTRRQASKQPQALNALAPIHAKHKQPSGYTREAYTPSGYTLRLRL